MAEERPELAAPRRPGWETWPLICARQYACPPRAARNNGSHTLLYRFAGYRHGEDVHDARTLACARALALPGSSCDGRSSVEPETTTVGTLDFRGFV